MNRSDYGVALLVVACCSLTLGCSSSERPVMASVRGQVTYQGKPVADATVAFLCPGAPRIAVGTTDRDGNYQLTTFEQGDGAPIGTHVVTVNKHRAVDDSVAPATTPAMDSKSMSKAIEEEMNKTVAGNESAKPLLPAKYANRSTSDLRKEVVEGENVINIELSD